MNYEAELDVVLLNNLKKLYGIRNEEVAYKVFLLRFLIENYDIYRMSNNKDLELEVKMPNFLVSELNLPLVNGCMYYKNEKITFLPDTKNSISNILDNWFFMYADSFTLNSRGDSVQKLSLVEDELNEIFKKAEKNVKLKKAR